jgi:hypothetical protein
VYNLEDIKKAIINNIDIIDEYKLKDLYEKSLIPNYFNDKYGIYLRVEGRNIVYSDLGFSIPVETLFNKIEKELVKFINSQDSDELDLIKRYGYLKHSNYMYVRKEGTGVYNVSSMYGTLQIADLMDILYWAITDEITDDLEEVNSIMDNYPETLKLYYRSLSYTETIKELDNITLIVQKNGKVKIRNVDQDVLDRVDYLIHLIMTKVKS